MNLLVINSGSAHDYMLRRYAHLAGLPIEEAVLITLQLGGGCSAAAIRGGRSVDTSMGFTPLEGLMMGTRTGDLDPGLLLDPVRNAAATGVECRISRDAALVQAWVVPVDEAALMAEAADECLRLLGQLPNA